VQGQASAGAAKQHHIDTFATDNRVDHTLKTAQHSLPLLVFLRAGQRLLGELQNVITECVQPRRDSVCSLPPRLLWCLL
jgi:hypothetical protein